MGPLAELSIRSTMAVRRVYGFGPGMDDRVIVGDPVVLLGGKGAGLVQMSRLGLPVPPGFTLTTAVGDAYRRNGDYPDGLLSEVEEALIQVEAEIGARFGDAGNPLLVAVRSG